MSKKDKIATYYCNARELIKQKNPKAARSYILLILSDVAETYYSATSILSKAKTKAFWDKWLAVSRELYDRGITDYVLECFDLLPKQKSELVKKPSQKKEPEKQIKIPETEVKGVDPSSDNGNIDIDGLIEETSKTQGWCAEIFEKAKTSVVKIATSSSLSAAEGTGFIISKNGYLLTNHHVVFDDKSEDIYSKIKMSLFDSKKGHKIEVLFFDKAADIALCKFDASKVSSFESVKRIEDYSTLKQGADCLIIGNAFGMGLAPFTGVVRFTKNDKGNLVYTAPSNPGDSGGPVFNRQGECIGINKTKTIAVNGVEANGYANATPMDKINSLLQKWIKKSDIVL